MIDWDDFSLLPLGLFVRIYKLGDHSAVLRVTTAESTEGIRPSVWGNLHPVLAVGSYVK